MFHCITTCAKLKFFMLKRELEFLPTASAVFLTPVALPVVPKAEFNLEVIFFFQETFLLSLQSSTYKTILALLTKITLLTLRATYSTYNTIQYSTFLHVKTKITLLHYAKKNYIYAFTYIPIYTCKYLYIYLAILSDECRTSCAA